MEDQRTTGSHEHGEAPGVSSRRQAMLEVLRRLHALRSELREKYGEFDIDRDLEEMRTYRLPELS